MNNVKREASKTFWIKKMEYLKQILHRSPEGNKALRKTKRQMEG